MHGTTKCLKITRYFRGEVAGELMVDDAGRSSRLCNRSTSRSRLHQA